MKSAKKNTVILSILCLAILFLLPLGNGKNIHAATTGKRAKAIEAYGNALAGKKSVKPYSGSNTSIYLGKNTKFMITDIDGNKIPELILEDFKWDGRKIFTYKNGKIKYVTETDYAALNIYLKKHVIMLSQTDFGFKDYVWYKYTKGKLKKVAEQDFTGYKNGKNTYKYYVTGKKTTKAKYKKYVKKLKGKKLKLNLVENTETNRNLYLK